MNIIDLTEKPKKPLQFYDELNEKLEMVPATKNPEDFENIEIISKSYKQGCCLFYCYNKERKYGTIFTGVIFT
jgi:hypothetical protein